eukprot:scpid86906/ scgid7273/ 
MHRQLFCTVCWKSAMHSLTTARSTFSSSNSPDVVQPTSQPHPVNHTTVHFIETTGPPGHVRLRRLPPACIATAKTEFQHMKDLRIIRPSASPWALPLHVVPKQNGNWRPCGDYRQLNAKSVPDMCLMPHLQGLLHGFTAPVSSALHVLIS